MPNSPQPKVFGYNAEAMDFSTGIQYLRARYYEFGVQRFIHEDEYRGEFTNPISMNRYAFVHNNPVMGIDPSGYASISNLDRKIASMKPRQLIDGGNPNYRASEEYRNRKTRTPEEYYRNSRLTEVGSNGVPNSISFDLPSHQKSTDIVLKLSRVRIPISPPYARRTQIFVLFLF